VARCPIPGIKQESELDLATAPHIHSEYASEGALDKDIISIGNAEHFPVFCFFLYEKKRDAGQRPCKEP